MTDGTLSGIQRTLQRHASPELFAAMERDSRLWKADCPHCGAAMSVWEMGGVRYKAVGGKPSTRMRCRSCGKVGWMKVQWTGGDPHALGPRPSAAPLILKFVLVTMIVPLAILGIVLFFLLR